MKTLYYLEHAACARDIASQLITSGMDDTTEIPEEDHVAGLAPFCKLDMINQKLSPNQLLILYLLNTLQNMRYRRYVIFVFLSYLVYE